MKILIFTDLHLGKKLSNSYFLDLDKKVIESICQEAVKSKIEKIIFLGDFFHNRAESSPKTMCVARESLDKLNNLNIPIIMILGNHDTYFSNKKDFNYYRIFNGLFSNIRFVENIEEDDEGFLYVGWMRSPEEEEQYKKVSKNHKWIFGHFEFKGAEMSEYYKTANGMENLNPDSYIFSGHIHQRSQQGKLYYIGSPYPQTWLSKNRHDYGYCLINTETEEIKYIDLGLYYFNEYKLQNLLMEITTNEEKIKKKMLNSETKVIVDKPLTEKELSELKIYLNTFGTKDLIVEKEDVEIISDNISYNKLVLSNPQSFIVDFISNMKLEEVTKKRILDKIKGMLKE